MRRRDDSGSVMLALLGILVISSVLLVVTSTAIVGQVQARHDTAFEQTLHAAEIGLDAMTAKVRSNPFATSMAALDDTDPTTGIHYHAVATPTLNAAGASTGAWTVNASGKYTGPQGKLITRQIRAKVTTGTIFDFAAFGKTLVNFNGNGGGSAVDSYDSSAANGSAVCNTDGVSRVDYGTQGTLMCYPKGAGSIATEGSLFIKGGDAAHIDSIDIYWAKDHVTDPLPDAQGYCNGIPATCGLPALTYHREKIDLPTADICKNGIGGGSVANTGNAALAPNAVYSYTDVTVTPTLISRLSEANSRLIICFNGSLNIPSTTLNGTTAADGHLVPRPPGSLIFMSTPRTSGNPQVNLGKQGSLSAAIYAPNADCNVDNHYDLYGSLICNSIGASSGMNVHYDVALANLQVDLPVTVSDWVELH
jgi:hypothetical protein